MALGCDADEPVQILRARLAEEPASKLWDVSLAKGRIHTIDPHHEQSLVHLGDMTMDANGSLLLPSMCHAHIHLDKCFLLDDQRFKDLQVEEGTFDEAMDITSKAKKLFTQEDLVRRGSRLVEESIYNGVTAMRAFVEVDEIAELRSLQAAIELRVKYRGRCEVQICAFAQLALFSGAQADTQTRRDCLMRAAEFDQVEVLGSTPYVEEERSKMEENVRFLMDLAREKGKMLDFHMDYNLDAEKKPLTWYVLDHLDLYYSDTKVADRLPISLGHCTRLASLSNREWQQLREKIGFNPVHFVGLPLSDLFIMGRPTDEADGASDRPRGTLQVPRLIQDHGLQACMAINNVGNGFTPYSNSDPLRLASFGTVVYQAATNRDTELLYVSISPAVGVEVKIDEGWHKGCISTRAMQAIGLPSAQVKIAQHQPADLVLLGNTASQERAGVVPSVSGIVRCGQASVLEVFKDGRRLLAPPPPPAAAPATEATEASPQG